MAANVLETLVQKIKNPKTLGMQYQDFATFFVFDPASPDKKTTSISSDIANKVSQMDRESQRDGHSRLSQHPRQRWQQRRKLQRCTDRGAFTPWIYGY